MNADDLKKLDELGAILGDKFHTLILEFYERSKNAKLSPDQRGVWTEPAAVLQVIGVLSVQALYWQRWYARKTGDKRIVLKVLLAANDQATKLLAADEDKGPDPSGGETVH